MDHHILSQIVLIFGISVAVLFGCSLLKIPNVVGLLIAGVLVGPDGLRLATDSEQINMLSEIGVVMLLFTIGMEFSLKDLARIRNQVLVGGSLQVFLTLGAVAVAGHAFGLGWNEAVFLGFLLCLSSTAIVLNIIQGRDEMNSPQGRMSLAILIFQDIIVVPMMLLVPILAGKGGNLTQDLLMLLLKGAGIIIVTLLAAQYVMPRLLYQVARLRSQEIFLLSVIVICFGVAWLTGSLGILVIGLKLLVIGIGGSC